MSGLFNEPILFVDDDVNLIQGISRQLHRNFELDTAEGPEAALALIDEKPPYAVIVSDMRMPGMDGIEFLAEAQRRSPDTVRIMLTGNADLDTAMSAVNESNIFRFLVKPVSKATLSQAIAAGIRQYRLIISERELLEQTLGNSMQVLSDILCLVNPDAFSRASRGKVYCDQLAELLELEDRWEYQVAALLSQVGCVAVPADVLSKVDASEELSASEDEMYSRHPLLARDLLEKIPRLERVATWIGDQQRSYAEFGPAADGEGRPHGEQLGGMMLRAAIDLDTLISGGFSKEKSVGKMRVCSENYHPDILALLHELRPVEVAVETRVVTIEELNASMVFSEDVLTSKGLLLAKQGQTVSPSMKARLVNYFLRRELEDRIRINVVKGVANSEADAPVPA